MLGTDAVGVLREVDVLEVGHLLEERVRARRHGLRGATPIEQARCDELLGAVDDVREPWCGTISTSTFSA